MLGTGWERMEREGTGLVPVESPTIRSHPPTTPNIRVTLISGWMLSNPGQLYNEN